MSTTNQNYKWMEDWLQEFEKQMKCKLESGTDYEETTIMIPGCAFVGAMGYLYAWYKSHGDKFMYGMLAMVSALLMTPWVSRQIFNCDRPLYLRVVATFTGYMILWFVIIKANERDTCHKEEEVDETK